MLSTVHVLIALILLGALLLMSVLDFALASLNKIALRRLADAAGAKSGPLWVAMIESRAEVLTAIHISIQILLISIAVLMTSAFMDTDLPDGLALLAGAVTTLCLVLVFRQFIPRAMATANPDGILARLVPTLTIPYYLLFPLVKMMTALVNRFGRWEEETEVEAAEDASEEEIQAFIDAGQEEGILEEDEGEMIQSIVEFGDKSAMEVMTPRTQIVAADVSWNLERMVNLIVTKRHSRVPVYRDELDNIEGVLHERDLLRLWKAGEEPENFRAVLHPAHFVPETKPIDDLLQEMKAEGHQFVLVVDEYGGVAGLITIEDLVEEIVGEIKDGSDVNLEKLVETDGGNYLVPGRCELETLEDRLGMPLVEETECTTVGGAVVELFGRLPDSGEKIEHQGLSIEVVSADRRRVRQIRIRAIAPPDKTS